MQVADAGLHSVKRRQQAARQRRPGARWLECEPSRETIMKKNWSRSLAAAAALLGVSVTAWAGQDTSYFTIQNLDAITSANSGYKVYPRGYSLPNPAGCVNSAYAEISSSATAEDKENMSGALMTAFLGGRKVKLRIGESSCSADGYPVYYMVRLDAAN
jgi:hypothetical protein